MILKFFVVKGFVKEYIFLFEVNLDYVLIYFFYMVFIIKELCFLVMDSI